MVSTIKWINLSVIILIILIVDAVEILKALQRAYNDRVFATTCKLLTGEDLKAPKQT